MNIEELIARYMSPLRDGEGEGGAGGGDQSGQSGGEGAGNAGEKGGDQGAGSGGGEGEKKPGVKTALGGGEGDGAGQKQAAPAEFPADWREKMAGDDKKALDRLKRIQSPADFYKSYRDLEARLHSGNHDEPMPEDAEKAKEWREQRGIPDGADGYKWSDASLKSMTDADKPTVEAWSKYAHEHNIPQAHAAAAVDFLIEAQNEAAAEMARLDDEAMNKTKEALQEEWGADYKAFSKLASDFAAELADVEWWQARLPDGRALGNIPEISKGFLRLALDVRGDMAYEGTTTGSALHDELSALHAERKADLEKFEADKTKSARLLELTEKLQKK